MLVPKPSFNRRVPKRKDRTNFSRQTIKEIFERDHYQCVRCYSSYIESVPHHVVYRSQLGDGSKQNGITVCRNCHNWFHENKKTNNNWAVEWVKLNLDENGNLLNEIPIMPNRLSK